MTVNKSPLAQANEAYRKKDYDNALRLYVAAQKLYPELKAIIDKNIENTRKHIGLITPTNVDLSKVSIDIVVPVFNAFEDVKKCLTSLSESTDGFKVNIIVVNDGSDEQTTTWLREFCNKKSIFNLIENPKNLGYTKTINFGLKASKADYVITQNSDTIVSKGWLSGLLNCMNSDSKIGICGPLSNAATWQNVPNLYDSSAKQHAVNDLPEGFTVAQMAEIVATASLKLYPRLPFVNGFCFMIKREVINKIGYMDEENFPIGYGEENDYCIRALDAGYELAIADDVYVYHAKSKSFGHEKRKVLSVNGTAKLKQKHGADKYTGLIDLANDTKQLNQIRTIINNKLFSINSKNYIEVSNKEGRAERLTKSNVDIVANKKAGVSGADISRIFDGRIEKNDGVSFRGWAVKRTDINAGFELDVLIDGVLFCKVKNNGIREDLKRLGKSGGRGGFNLTIPQELLTNEIHTVQFKWPDGNVCASVDVLGLPLTVQNDSTRVLVNELVSIIVPIYNAPNDLQVCIDRLIKYTSSNTDIILINDASTDYQINEILNNLTQKNIRVFHNSINLGFTKTVNRGIELAGKNDVVLLNSDARVTPRWLEGLKSALSTDAKIATVTPMSDRAGAFSAPNIGNINELPVGVKEEEYAIAFRRRSVGYYPTVPTGNGFCMYVRRKCINEIGMLDEQAFPRGYGEENDFCMRARAQGWRNVIDDRTYVFHDRSKSFGEEKESLILAGRVVIDARYPDYSKAIGVFSHSSLINAARFRARQALDDCYKLIKPRVLYVISTVTGGTPQTNRDLMCALIDTNEPWLFRCDSNEMILYKVHKEGDEIIERYTLKEPVDALTHLSQEYDKVLVSWLARYDFEVVHIRHMAWHSLSLPKLAKEAGAKVINSFHDFYALCPTVKLIDDQSVFCGGKCTSGNGRCATQLWQPDSLPTLKNNWVKVWRSKFSDALKYCDAFVTTSSSAMVTITENLELSKEIPFEVIEHGRDFIEFRSPDRSNLPTSKVKVLVPGNIDAAKGLKVIEQLLNYDKGSRLEFHILGKCDFHINDKRVIQHGRYKREEFISHVKLIKPHLGVVLSIWNETWCHTLTELWASGLPAVVFDFPTVASRVSHSNAGWIANSSDIKDLYLNLTQGYINRNEYLSKLDSVLTWQKSTGTLFTVQYMAVQYLNMYKGRKGDSLKKIIAVVCPSNSSQTKAPGSTHIRVWQKTLNSIHREVTYLRMTSKQLISGLYAGHITHAIVQRNVLVSEEWAIVRRFVLDNKFSYIYDIDDDLLDVPEDKDTKGVYNSYRGTLTEIIRLANKLLVSTNSLFNKYRLINDKVDVHPNYISRECWLPESNREYKKNKFNVIYFGSHTHKEDFELILPQLRRVYKKYPEFRLKLVGIYNTGFISEPWIQIIPIPDASKDYIPFVKFLRSSASDCSIGIAPLVTNNFNSYKSDIKLKEYLSLGLRVVASNTGPYQSFSCSSENVEKVLDSCWFDWFDKFFSHTSFYDEKVKGSGLTSEFLFNEYKFDVALMEGL